MPFSNVTGFAVGKPEALQAPTADEVGRCSVEPLGTITSSAQAPSPAVCPLQAQSSSLLSSISTKSCCYARIFNGLGIGGCAGILQISAERVVRGADRHGERSWLSKGKVQDQCLPATRPHFPAGMSGELHWEPGALPPWAGSPQHQELLWLEQISTQSS